MGRGNGGVNLRSFSAMLPERLSPGIIVMTRAAPYRLSRDLLPRLGVHELDEMSDVVRGHRHDVAGPADSSARAARITPRPARRPGPSASPDAATAPRARPPVASRP